MKVLLVDDDPNILEQTKIFLKKEIDRINPKNSNSAKEALEKLKNRDFKAVVSDYQMTEMDGLEFLEILRNERNNDIPFMIFTGKGREEVAMKALNLEADRYLQKGGDPRPQYGVLANAILDEIKNREGMKDLGRYKQMIKTVDFPVMFQDKEGKYKVINDAVAEYLDFPKEKSIWKH